MMEEDHTPKRSAWSFCRFEPLNVGPRCTPRFVVCQSGYCAKHATDTKEKPTNRRLLFL